MQGHGHGHGGEHGHGHGCAADHHRGEYTERQRADLDMVLAFNHRLVTAIEGNLDITDTIAALDPDPLRYMWVDEGDGEIPAQLAKAAAVLDTAPRLAGQTRGTARPLRQSRNAARPTVAVRGATTLVAWLEWEEDRGDRLLAELRTADGRSTAVVVDVPQDLFRPTAAVTAAGVPWLVFGRSVDAKVGVWACRFADGRWSDPVPVSDTDGPSFNQEVVASDDGALHVCWQGRAGGRFAVFARRWHGAGWAPTVRVSAVSTDEEAVGNVWDPSLAVVDGGVTYAWTEYVEGSYAIALRHVDGSGAAGPVRRITGGTDYALHPSLATTADGRLWCAFDVVSVQGHGGSGPTRLRPRPTDGGPSDEQVGMREPGRSVPPELLPEVSAGIRVVGIAGDALVEAPGELARGLNVVPSAMPRLQATADGGLVVGYRVHRQLPLMTYYWEAAAQVLGPDGWAPPVTFGGTDATLEEVSLAAAPSGVVLATQADGRLERALHWSEGFGGRECPYLADHHGAVIWHGVHGAGQVVLTTVASAGPATHGGRRSPMLVSAERREARRWAGTDRPVIDIPLEGEGYRLYWGDLHRHSLVSRCTSGDEPSLEDFYRYAWDVNEYDFWAVTDHAENSTAYQWWSIQKIADLLHVPDRFVPLYGFEWTSAEHGHQNVIYGDVARGAPIFSAFAEGSTTPDGLWRGLAAHPGHPAITIPHHPGSAMVHNDWDYHDPRFARLVEVFQACRGNYESQMCFRQYSDGTATGTFMLDGLQRGHRFGLIASSDHGHGASYVAVLARSLRRADVFDGLWSRRTCAATTRGVVAVLRMGPHLMGSEADWSGPRPLTVHARGYADLARVDILRDGRVVHVVRGEPPLPAGHLRVDVRVEWGQADTTTRWDGKLAVDGGTLALPTYVGPEVVAMDEHAVEWRHLTHSFGEPYGAQRGGVEVSVCGPDDARVSIACAGRSITVGLGELAERLAGGPFVPEGGGGPGTLALQPAVGALLGLGARDLDVTFVDDEPLDGDGFYYARAFQVDGELAWSSPIWVRPVAAAPV